MWRKREGGLALVSFSFWLGLVGWGGDVMWEGRGGWRGKGRGREGERGSYVPSGAAVWLMGKDPDGTRVSVSVSVLVLWKVGSGSGIGGGCGRGGVGAWFVGCCVWLDWIGLVLVLCRVLLMEGGEARGYL